MLAFPCKAFHDLIPTDGLRRPAGCPAAEEALAMDLAAENGEHDAARLWTGRGSRGGELVAGTSGISRLPMGGPGRCRRFAVPVRWRGAPLRRTPAGPRAGTRRPDGWTPGTGIGVVLTVPGVTWDPGGDDVRGCILTLAGAGRSTEDPGADEGAACQRGSSGPTHSRSYLAACPARTRMTMTSSSLMTAVAWLPLLPIRRRVLPGSIHAGRARHTAVPQPGAPRGHRMLRQHPGRARAGVHAPAVCHRIISNSQPGLITVPGARRAGWRTV
jgi:hypothetical protein